MVVPGFSRTCQGKGACGTRCSHRAPHTYCGPPSGCKLSPLTAQAAGTRGGPRTSRGPLPGAQLPVALAPQGLGGLIEGFLLPGKRGVLQDLQKHSLLRSARRDLILCSEGTLNGFSPLDKRELPLHNRCLPRPCCLGSRSERSGLSSWPGPLSSWGHRRPLGHHWPPSLLCRGRGQEGVEQGWPWSADWCVVGESTVLPERASL